MRLPHCCELPIQTCNSKWLWITGWTNNHQSTTINWECWWHFTSVISHGFETLVSTTADFQLGFSCRVLCYRIIILCTSTYSFILIISDQSLLIFCPLVKTWLFNYAIWGDRFSKWFLPFFSLPQLCMLWHLWPTECIAWGKLTGRNSSSWYFMPVVSRLEI